MKYLLCFLLVLSPIAYSATCENLYEYTHIVMDARQSGISEDVMESLTKNVFGKSHMAVYKTIIHTAYKVPRAAPQDRETITNVFANSAYKSCLKQNGH